MKYIIKKSIYTLILLGVGFYVIYLRNSNPTMTTVNFLSTYWLELLTTFSLGGIFGVLDYLEDKRFLKNNKERDGLNQ